MHLNTTAVMDCIAFLTRTSQYGFLPDTVRQ